MFEAVGQQGAVGQFGQRVALRHEFQLFLGLPVLVDVHHHTAQPQRRLLCIAGQHTAAPGHPGPAAHAARQAEFGVQALAVPGQVLAPARAPAFQVLRVHQQFERRQGRGWLVAVGRFHQGGGPGVEAQAAIGQIDIPQAREAAVQCVAQAFDHGGGVGTVSGHG